MTFDPGADPFRIRFSILNEGEENAAAAIYQIYVSKNGGAYAPVTTTSTMGVKSTDAGSSVDETAITVPRLSTPDWWLANAAVDLDFAANKYYEEGIGDGLDITDYLSVSRASNGYAKNVAGAWVGPFSANELRITDLGLLIEDARTNNLLNSGAPVTQTTASLGTGDYTLWVEGSGSAAPSAGSASITGGGTATDGSPDVFTVTVAGTVVVTVTGTLDRFQLENGAFPSSYIPTTGTSAARAADVVTIIGNFSALFSGVSGSLFSDIKLIYTPGTAVGNGLIGSSDGTQALIDAYEDTKVLSFYNVGDRELFATLGNEQKWSTGAKAAYGWDGSSRSLVGGGGTVVSDAFPVTLATNLGHSGWGQVYPFAYFRRLAVFNSRLSDGALQALTI